MPYERNPTNLPQNRPIEDLWGTLTDLVYKDDWTAKSLQQLRYRIITCLKKLGIEFVGRSFAGILRKLRLVYEKGALAACH